ncbi:sodium/potassium/calcium exchanger 3 isoform X2 [Electrophorus electricus]|uniref:sodium/potassium/calcium exchanger 3 isoform X2 n=1 Tax=Electrophorus electricus TaxID=8005 RepID=UPI0015D0AC5F|nr:sodium/potassium/calcium exchanger 3 isoform X2 [Electrophorus electricus]
MKSVMRSRRRRPLRRFCCWGFGLLAVVWLVRVQHLTETVASEFEPAEGVHLEWSRRNLMQDGIENHTLEAPRAAIHEFPEDIFTKEQRRKGAVLLHVLCAIYMFYALAIVCDDYFVPSLEKISENLQLSEDVAGATFMAAGSSAPELFTSLIGVFITKGDVGVGTIVGSAVFNILVIIGVCGIFAGQTVTLTWWSLFRDSLYYILSVLALILVIYDERVVWWESMLLISMYGVYILIMKFNSQIASFVERRCGAPGRCCLRGEANPNERAGEEGANCNTSMVLLRKGQPSTGQQESPVVMVDELLILKPHQLSFPEAGLRIMITPHFSPRTRLSMAGRVLISERQRLIRESGLGGSSTKSFGSGGIENGGSVERPLEDGDRGVKAAGGRQPEEDAGDEFFRPLHVPAGCAARAKWVVSWPLGVLLYYTVPNCVLPRWHRWFMVTFITSTLWIAIFSYLMVWMVTIISYTLDIPDYIMGITFLAAGTSVPDCMASLIVARQGMGDMAVSNSIGSNIFDILLGLGFPWVLRTLVVDHGSAVFINNKGLVYSVVLLLASVFLTVLSVYLNGWKLDRRLGLGLMLLYSMFLLCSILFGQL